MLQVFVDWKGSVAAELPESCDTGHNTEPQPLSIVITVDDEGHFGSRADERHVAANNVKQLRQLVEAGSTQNPSDSGDTGVARRSRRALVSVSVRRHRTEFVHSKQAASETDAFLNKDGRTFRVQPDERCNEKKERR